MYNELTARINDEGWDTSFSNWLKISNINQKDALFIFSVGGGNQIKKVSVNIVNAIKFAKSKKTKIFGIVSRDGGYTKKRGDNVITSGGIVGTVERIIDNEKIEVSISENVNVEIVKSTGIQGLINKTDQKK